MTASKPNDRLTVQAFQQVALLVLIEVVLIFILPANQAAMHMYHLSSLQYRIVLFAVTLPTLVTWWAAFLGFATLRQYVNTIQDTPEEPYFSRLAQGCGWLAWSLPVSAILMLVLSATADQWPSLYSTAVIISNYVNLVLSVIAFSIIGGASRGLVNLAKLKFSLASVRSIIVLFLLGGVSYCYLTFRHFDLTSLNSTHNAYYLAIWLMVISVMIPYLYAWFSGLLAAYEIDLFSKRTDGVLYRQALRLLVIGLLTIIVSFVALQYMNSLHPGIGPLSLNYQMVLTSVFRVIGGAGFVALAFGALQLKKIEEV